MARRISIEEAKALPMWPQMNRYIKEFLAKEMGDVEYEIIPFDTYWEIHVDGIRVAEMGIEQLEEKEVPMDVRIDNLNLN